ncbi:hypothetical protein [Leptolyngbya sp. NIES-2104]|uniref:hypothetical protein n=1 Tax=Leptolyngbya sp. NIES-2104 TaxID=1552121 RepID=UPI0012E337F5|nr:hypothetical protein [Leptolyngbya sp. NIES-2104]
MKALIFRTAFALAIASVSSAAYAKEPVPQNGTTGEAATRRLEVIQQHNRDGELPAPQPPSSNSSQILVEQRSTVTESAREACQLKPVTAGAMAQRAFAALLACQRRAQ